LHSAKWGSGHEDPHTGKITPGAGTSTVRWTISDILENGGKKIVPNLTEVDYIDSSGIGEPVRAHAPVTREGEQLKLLNLTNKIQELLVITRLLTVFQVFDSGRAAVASFAWWEQRVICFGGPR